MRHKIEVNLKYFIKRLFLGNSYFWNQEQTSRCARILSFDAWIICLDAWIICLGVWIICSVTRRDGRLWWTARPSQQDAYQDTFEKVNNIIVSNRAASSPKISVIITISRISFIITITRISLPEIKEHDWVTTNPQDIVWRYIVLSLSCDFQNIVEISLSHFFWEYHTIFNYEILVYFSLSMDLWKLNNFTNFLWSDI